MKKSTKWMAALLVLLLLIWARWTPPSEPTLGVRLVLVPQKPAVVSTEPNIVNAAPADVPFMDWRDTFVDDTAQDQESGGSDPFTVVCDETVCVEVFQQGRSFHDFAMSSFRRPQILVEQNAVSTVGDPIEYDRCDAAFQAKFTKSWHAHLFHIDGQVCVASAPPFTHNRADHERHINAGLALCQSAVRDNL